MTLDYNRLKQYLTRADSEERAGFNHPERMESPIGKHGKGATFEPTPRFISTSARTNGTTILTPRKYFNLLHAHDAPPGLLERTEHGWLFRDLRIGGEPQNLEYRTFLLDNEERHPQHWWHNDYQQTREGREGWRLPTTEEIIALADQTRILDKTHYHNDVQLILNGDPQNNIPGLRRNIGRWPILADHIQYGNNFRATITNPLGKKEKVTIPIYQNNYLTLAPEQHEGLLGTQVTPDEAAWLEALVGEKWAQLPQILQFIAPRQQIQAPESFGHEQESHLQEARIWTPEQQDRNRYPGRVVHLGVGGFSVDVVSVGPAFGVRSAQKISTGNQG